MKNLLEKRRKFFTYIQAKQKNIFQFTAKDIDGNTINFDQYQGKVLLIVNVASE